MQRNKEAKGNEKITDNEEKGEVIREKKEHYRRN